MVRTQIYLTEEEQVSLQTLAVASGRSQSEIIRQAVDEFVTKSTGDHRLQMIRKARGIWKNREDTPDIRALREGWRRRS